LTHPEVRAFVTDVINDMGSAWPNSWGFWYRLEVVAWTPIEPPGVLVTARIVSRESEEDRLFPKAVAIEEQQMMCASTFKRKMMGSDLVPRALQDRLAQKTREKAVIAVRKVRKAVSTYDALSLHLKFAIPEMTRCGDLPSIPDTMSSCAYHFSSSDDSVSPVTPLRDLDRDARRLDLVRILENKWCAILCNPHDPRGEASLLKKFDELPEI